MIPENLKNKIVNTTIDISQYINDEYFRINNNVAYLVKVGKIRMIKVDVTLKKEINTDIYLFNFPTNFLDIINTYFFGNLIDRSGKSYDVAFYNQLESNNFSILIQPQYDNPIAIESRIIGEWVGFCKSADTDINAEDDKYLNKEEVQALISEALDGAILKETFEKSQAEQDKLIQKLQSNMINESTEETTSLYIEDASDVPAKLSVEGNHYQETQEGSSNLAVLQEGSITQDGITIDIENGVASFSGVSTSDTTAYIKVGTAYLYEGQTYYMNIDRDQSSGSSGFSIKKSTDGAIWFTSGTEKAWECTSTGEYDIRVSFAPSTINEIGTFRALISKTSGAEWMQGKKAIPSIEYPSKIKTIGDNVNILPNEAKSKKVYEIEWNVNKDGSVHAKGTAIANETLYLCENNYEQEAFRFKAKKQYKNVGNVDIIYQKTDGNYGRLTKDTVFSFDEDLVCGLVYLMVEAGQTVDETYYPKIVEYYEGIDESYSPYGMGSVKITKVNKNMFNVPSEHKGGVDLILQDDESYLINGTSNASWVYRTGEVILLKAGNYILSVEFENEIEPASFNGFFGVRGSGIKYETRGEIEISLTEDKLVECYFTCSSTATFDNVIAKVQLEKDAKTDWVKHEEKKYTLPVQQLMLEGDYFDLENEKEVHNWGYINTKNVANLTVSLNTSNGDFRRYSVDLKINGRKSGEYLKIICTHFKYTDSRWHESEGICGWESGQTFCIGTFNKELDTAEKMKNYLLNNDVEIYYELAEQKELALTEEQKQVLQQLDNLNLFKGTNSIYTEQDLALLQLDYTVDTKMYIDNKIASQNQQLDTIKELLSTTGTSAMLLDNLQNDLESEVM